MSTTSAADKRKIRRLEEDLEEAEKQKKSLERKVQNLTRDFEEVNEKYEALGKFKFLMTIISLFDPQSRFLILLK